MTFLAARRAGARTFLPAVSLLLLSVLLVPVAAASDGAAAAAGTAAAATTSLPAAEDYASAAFSDPWDYSNPEDASTSPGVSSRNVTGLRYEDGVLRMDAKRGGWLSLAGAMSGALPRERDTRSQPLDAARWTMFSTRVWSSKDTTMQVFWFSCIQNQPYCSGAMQLPVKAGWNLLDARLQNNTGTPAPWSGKVSSIRVVPAATTDAAVAFDFVRLYQPSTRARTTVTAPASGSLFLDVDRDPGNGNQTALRTVAKGSHTVDLSGLAAGTWHLGVRTSSSVTYAPAVVLGSGPLPVLLQPDVAGGRSYAAVARGGDEWDFSQTSDVLGFANVTGGQVSSGWAHGTNGAPNQNDPQVRLRLGAVPIDGNRFHRLTVRLHHEGGFSLADAPGGGMMTRLVWQTKGDPAAYQDLEDVVVSPGTDQFSIDLATSPAQAVVDPNTPKRIGWAGQQVTSVRLDPNEDPGARRWRIDEVRIAEDDRPTGDSFDITFADRAALPGTTASVYVDRDASGFDGTLVRSGVQVLPGVNTVTWDTAGAADGRYWVYVVLDDGDQVRRAYSTGPVRVEAGADVSVVPGAFGRLDAASPVPGGVEVRGWAIDPAAAGGASSVRVRVDGRTVSQVAASSTRADVGAVYPAFGPAHGYLVRLAGLAEGTRRVCVDAVTAPARPDTELGCRDVSVAVAPFGRLDRLSRVPGGLRADGWAVDASTAAPTDVHVRAGTTVRAGTADRPRPDVGAAHPRYGPDHGYSVTVPVSGGRHQVCAYGIDTVAPGRNATLGCRTVDVSGDPFGRLDAAQRTSATSVRLRGWALDPDTASTTEVHVWHGGRLVARTTAGTDRADIARAFPGYGAAHGFDTRITVGEGRSCAYAVNRTGTGGSRLLGCTTV